MLFGSVNTNGKYVRTFDQVIMSNMWNLHILSHFRINKQAITYEVHFTKLSGLKKGNVKMRHHILKVGGLTDRPNTHFIQQQYCHIQHTLNIHYPLSTYQVWHPMIAPSFSRQNA